MKKLSVLPVLFLLALPAGALTYTGGANQFAGGFSPANAPYGGFGGGACSAVKTPIVFLHGNGDEAKNWDYPSSTGVASVYDEFRAAGYNDQIACSTNSYYTGCGDTAKFDSYTNVKSQLNVGRGSTAAQYDYDFSDWSLYNTGGGDADGVGHFRAKNNTGAIQRNMITTACTGTGCCTGYGYSCQ